MAPIPDITDTERWLIQTTLRERYGHDLEFQLADAEVRLHPSDRELTSCPVIVWQSQDGCTFVLVKSGERSYRGQFFYKPYQQIGTGVQEYEDLAECAVALLQAQADYAAEQRGDLPVAVRCGPRRTGTRPRPRARPTIRLPGRRAGPGTRKQPTH